MIAPRCALYARLSVPTTLLGRCQHHTTRVLTDSHQMRVGNQFSRASVVRPLITAALASIGTQLQPLSAAAAPTPTSAKSDLAAPAITDRVYLDLRIINRFDVEVLEDAATRGRLVIGLFGTDAPQGVERFLEFVDGTVGQYSKTGGGPSYAQSQFERVVPGQLLEGGRISGLKQTTFAGSLEWEYLSRLLPLRPVIEANDLSHDRRGLITRTRFGDYAKASGPEFGVTLNPARNLDNSNEVIGVVLEGLDLLEKIEELPYITGKSIEGEGTTANAVFQAQKSFFSGLSKSVGDSRAEDRTGRLLRRVEIVSCGRV